MLLLYMLDSYYVIIYYSRPPAPPPQYRRSMDWQKTAVLEKGSHILNTTKKKNIQYLKISGGIILGGGSQRRGSIEGGDCTII